MDEVLTKLDDIKTLLTTIAYRLDDTDARLEAISDDVDEIQKEIIDIKLSTTNMDSHIQTVDGVYKNVKVPFHTLMDKVGTYFGTNELEYDVQE